jgi:hypothetical protein
MPRRRQSSLCRGHLARWTLAKLTPTTVKTAAYPPPSTTWCPVDTTTAAVTITLPTAPAGKAACVKWVAG